MSKEYRHIVRIIGTDLDGSKHILNGLTSIKGVGKSLASAIVHVGGLKPETRIGNLTDPDIKKIEKIIEDPSGHGIPDFMLNRRKELESGSDTHLVGPDLELRIKTDVDSMRAVKSWKGVRHSLGLKVRGQRTKTTGRTGRSVGVKKKMLIAASRRDR